MVGSVGVEQGPVDGALVEGVEAENGPGEFGIDVGDGGGDTLAGPSVAAITQLDGLVPAGRGTARDDCPAGCATLEEHLGLERGVAARVEDLTGDDERDAAHCAAPRYSDRRFADPRLASLKWLLTGSPTGLLVGFRAPRCDVAPPPPAPATLPPKVGPDRDAARELSNFCARSVFAESRSGTFVRGIPSVRRALLGGTDAVAEAQHRAAECLLRVEARLSCPDHEVE